MRPTDNTTQVCVASGAIVSFQAFALERTDIDRERMHYTRQGRDLLSERHELAVHALLRRRQCGHPLGEHHELAVHTLLRRRQCGHPLSERRELYISTLLRFDQSLELLFAPNT